MKINMKFLMVLCMMLGFVGMQAQEISVIQGEWIEPAKGKSQMGLYQIRDGQLHELALSNLTADGRFAFAFYPEKEGYYAVANQPGSKMNRYIFYLKPGDDVQFRIQGDNWQLTGKNTAENKELERWHNLVQPLEGKAIYFMGKKSTFADYFPLLEETLPKVKAYGPAKTSNKVFNSTFEDFKKYNFLEINLMLLSTPRSAHPTKADFPAYYRNIDLKDLTSSLSILDYPQATWLVETAYRCRTRADQSLSDEESLERQKNAKDVLLGDESPIVNPVIKGEVLLNYASYVKEYPVMDTYRTRYGNVLATEDQQRRFNIMLGKLDDHSAGHQAIDFRFTDINGKPVALSDFKGKVVYIDIWATWCGPCRGEIPYMTKLEEEYKDNPNLVFMSVSIDQPQDEQKWKDMVAEKQMKGIQLFAGSKADDIAKPYKVRGIPRFILVGKDGKLIAGEAPRSSSDDIRPLLKKALAQ